MVFLENLKRTLWLIVHPLPSSAAFSCPCTCVGMMSSKALSKQVLSTEDWRALSERFLASNIPPLLLTSYSPSYQLEQHSIRCGEPNRSALASPMITFTVPFHFSIPPSYTSKTGPVDWLKHPTAGEQQRSLCKHNCCVGLTGSVMAWIKFPCSSG